MRKIINFFDDGFIRLITFTLFWVFFITYSVISEDIKFWNFLYYSVLYIPLTISLLKKSFYFSNLLILILGIVEIISSVGVIINCILSFEISILFTLIFSVMKFLLYAILFSYIITKLKNREFNELKNEYMGKIVLIILVINIIFGILNICLYVNQNIDTIASDIFGYLSSTVLLISQVMFVITCKKTDTLMKKID